jgi:hypothetical protein
MSHQNVLKSRELLWGIGAAVSTVWLLRNWGEVSKALVVALKHSDPTGSKVRNETDVFEDYLLGEGFYSDAPSEFSDLFNPTPPPRLR